MKSKTWTLFTDGACRGNPGPSGAGIYISENGDSLLEKSVFLGTKTNNQAEYLALALGAYFILDLAAKEEVKPKLVITADSELMIKQMKGEYRVKHKELRKIKNVIDMLISNIQVEYKHVLRIHNTKADQLANIAIDNPQSPPSSFLKLLEKQNFEF